MKGDRVVSGFFVRAGSTRMNGQGRVIDICSVFTLYIATFEGDGEEREEERMEELRLRRKKKVRD